MNEVELNVQQVLEESDEALKRADQRAKSELEKKSKARAKDEVKVLGEARLTESRAKTKAFAKLVADQKIRLAEKGAELREAQEAAATQATALPPTASARGRTSTEKNRVSWFAC